MGLFDVRQHAVPLETVIVRVGAEPGARRASGGSTSACRLADGTPAGALSEVTDLFSAGNFLDLTDDQKLSRPSFEPMPAGARIRPPGETVAARRSPPGRAALRDVRLRRRRACAACAAARRWTTFCRALGGDRRSPPARRGAAELRARARYATEPDPIVLADPGEVVRSPRSTLAAARAAVRTYTARRRGSRAAATSSSPGWGWLMADTLRVLAGDAFTTRDVISASAPADHRRGRVLRPLRLPAVRAHGHRRRAEPTRSPGASRHAATVEMTVPVIDDRGAGRRGDDRPRLRARRRHRDRPAAGDPRRSRRPTPPTPRSTTSSHIEFDRPDLPWLFTPARTGRRGPAGAVDHAGRAPSGAHVAWGEQRGRHAPGDDPPRPAAAARRRVGVGARAGDGHQGATRGPSLERAAGRGRTPPHNLSRLRLPAAAGRPHGVRRLRGADLPGRRAGRARADAAGDALTRRGARRRLRAGDPATMVDAAGLLLLELRAPARRATSRASPASSSPRSRPPGVGRRRVDATRPWLGDAPTRCTADDPGAEMVVEGPVVSPQTPERRTGGAVADRGAAALGRRRSPTRWSTSSTAPTRQAHEPRPGAAAGRPAAVRRQPRAPAAHRDRAGRPRHSRSGSASSTSTRATGSSAASARASCRPSRRT